MRTPLASQSKSFVRTRTFVRKISGSRTEEHSEGFQIYDVASSGNPPPNLGAFASEVSGKDWSDLAGLSYRGAGQQFMRGKQRQAPSVGYTEVTDTFFGLPSPGQFPIFLTVFGPQVFPTNAPAGYDGQLNFSGGLQACAWLYAPNRFAGTAATNVTRGRHQFNKAGNAFVVTAEMWVYYTSGGGGIGWIDFPTRDFDGIALKNFSLLVDEFSIPANTWYEPPFPSQANSSGGRDHGAGGFSDGFVGRANLVVRFESKTAWQIRTGVTL